MADLLTRPIVLPITRPLVQPVVGAWRVGPRPPPWFGEIGAPSNAISVWDWANGRAHQAGYYFQRASPAYDESAGVWVEYPHNHLRIRSGRGILIEPASRNFILNAKGDGVGAGVLPTDWRLVGTPLPNMAISGPESVAGFAGARLRMSGQPSSGGEFYIEAPWVTVLPGERVTASWFLRDQIHASGTTLGNNFLRLRFYNDQGGYISHVQAGIGQIPGTATRYKLTATVPVGTVSAGATILTAVGSAFNYTDQSFWYAMPQLEVGERETSPMPSGDASYGRVADQLTLYILPGAQKLTFVFDDESRQDIDVPGGDYLITPATLQRFNIKYCWTVAR